MAGKDRPHRVCILGASGKLGRYMVGHALNEGYEVVGVCREQSIPKLDEFADRIELHGGATDDREVIEKAIAGCGSTTRNRRESAKQSILGLLWRSIVP